MRKKRLTSWERRTRRRNRIMVLVILLTVFTAIAFLAFHLLLPYERWDLTDYFSVEFTGYNMKGSAVPVRDEVLLDEALKQLELDYKRDLIQLQTVDEEDYAAFRDSIQVKIISNGALSNGSRIGMEITYDASLAKKLRVDVRNTAETVTVSGLPTVTVLTDEDLFRDLSVSFTGISPKVRVQLTNHSENSFLKTVIFSPTEKKDYYETGDILRVQAYFDPQRALQENYVVETPSEACVREFVVEASGAYLTDAALLSSAVLQEAASRGLSAFQDANEYGVRIFCEAGLIPVYIDKKPTFEWVSPQKSAIYFKSVRPEYRGKNGNHFNELDVVYSAKIVQADGVSCSCQAAVRYTDLVLNADGTLSYDFSQPKMISADYRSENIRKTIVTMRESEYEVTKVE